MNLYNLLLEGNRLQQAGASNGVLEGHRVQCIRAAARSVFSHVDMTKRSILERLFVDQAEILTEGLNGSFVESWTRLFHRVCFAVLNKLDSLTQRTEAERFRREVVKAFSMNPAGRFVDDMTVRQVMDQLLTEDPEAHACLILKNLEDKSLKEVTALTGLSMQQVRTRLARGAQFFKQAYLGVSA